MKKTISLLFVFAIFSGVKAQSVYPFEQEINDSTVLYGLKSYLNDSVVLVPKYHAIGDFYEGYAKAYVQLKAAKWDENYNLLEEEVGKWGFIDSTGKEVVSPRYELAFYPYDQLIPVRLKGKWGFVNTRGKVIIKAKYAYVNYFENGLATVSKGKYKRSLDIGEECYCKVGLIDKKGKKITKQIYSSISSFSEGRALVSVAKYRSDSTEESRKYGYIDLRGREIIPLTFDDIYAFNDNGIAAAKWNGKWGFIDTTGKTLVEAKYDKFLSYNYDHPAFYEVRINEKIGFTDRNGTEIVSPKYDNIWSFKNKDSQTNHYYLVEENGKFGLCDNFFKEIIPTRFQRIYELGDKVKTFYAVSDNGKFGIVDVHGKILLTPKYDTIYYFKDGKAQFTLGDQCGFLDQNLKETLLPYRWVGDFYSNKALVMQGGEIIIDEEGYSSLVGQKMGLIDSQFKEILPTVYDNIDFNNGFYKVSRNGKYTLLDENYKEIFPPKYDEIGMSFDNSDYFIVALNGKYGYINLKGKEVLAPINDALILAYKGRFIVERASSTLLIDEKGKEIKLPKAAYYQAKPNYLELINESESPQIIYDWKGNVLVPEGKYDRIEVKNGFCKVSKNGKVGFLDRNFKLLIPLEYDYISDFFDGLAIVKKGCQWNGETCEGGKAGIIDYKGKLILDTKYEINELSEAQKLEQPIIIVRDVNTHKFGFLNRTNLHFTPPMYENYNYPYTGLNVLRVLVDSIQDSKNFNVDVNGKKIAETKIAELDNELIFEDNDLFGLKTKDGKIILEPKYNEIEPFYEGVALARIGNRETEFIPLFTINGEDSVLIDPITGMLVQVYDTIHSNFKLCYIDKTGKELDVKVSPYCFYCSHHFSDGLLADVKNTDEHYLYGFVDKSGKEAISFIYSDVRDFHNGLAIVSLSNFYGVIDKTGKFIIPPLYKSISETNENIFVCELKSKGDAYSGFIYFDSKGNEIEYYSPLSERDKSDILWKRHLGDVNRSSFTSTNKGEFIYTHGDEKMEIFTRLNSYGEDSVIMVIDPFTGEEYWQSVVDTIRESYFIQFHMGDEGVFSPINTKEVKGKPLFQIKDGTFYVDNYEGAFGAIVNLGKQNALGETQWSEDAQSNEFGSAKGLAFNLEGEVVYAQVEHVNDTTYSEADVMTIEQTTNLWIKKRDQNGNELFKAKLDGHFQLLQLQASKDGGYIMATYPKNPRKELYDGYMYDEYGYEQSILINGDFADKSSISVLKLNKKGEKEWEKSYKPRLAEFGCNDMQLTADGGFLLAGWSFAAGNDANSVLAKFDKNGKVEWEKSYGSEIYNAIQTPDKGYGILLSSNAQTGEFTEAGEQRFCFVKLDKNGNLLWKKSLGNRSDNYKTGLYLAKDGNFIITGTDNKGFFILKLKNK